MAEMGEFMKTGTVILERSLPMLSLMMAQTETFTSGSFRKGRASR